MVPVLAAGGAAIAEVVGGFAAAAATPEVLAAIVGGVAGIGGQLIARNAAVHTARYALGAAVAPWIGGVLLAGTILYGGYKIVQLLADKKDNIELHAGKDGLHVKANGRPLTTDEFSNTLADKKLVDALRKVLPENARQHNLSVHEVYLGTLDNVRNNPAFQNISDDDKIKLAKRLTDNLL